MSSNLVLIDENHPELGWRENPFSECDGECHLCLGMDECRRQYRCKRIARASQASQGVITPQGSWLSRKSPFLTGVVISIVAAWRAVKFYGVKGN